MSHVSGRTSSAKDKASKAFYRKIKSDCKDAVLTGKAGAVCKYAKCSKSESQHRMKKLRSRKERNQIRNGGKEAPRAKSCHYYYNHLTSKDVSYIHQCCHNTLDARPNIAPVTHEPVVITDSRLIGHHGLFNHEVKSIDIERLLSEQRKLDRSGKLQEKSSSIFANPPVNEAEYLLDSTNDEAVISNKKAPENNSKRQQKKTPESNSQGSELTPGQRSRKTQISSAEMNKSDNSTDVVVTGTKEAQPAMYENNSESRQTLCSFNKNNKSVLPGSLPSIKKRTSKNPASVPKPSQVGHSTPPLPSSPHMAGTSSSFNARQENLVADSVAMSVKAIATGLCSSISFSLLKENKKLVAKSRKALVKELRQRHGAQMKSNILKVQQQLYNDDGQEQVAEQSHSPIFADRKEWPFSTGEFPTASKAKGFPTSSFEKTGRLVFDWNSTDWSNPLDQNTEWLGTPAENPAVLSGAFSPIGSPLFSEDFELRNSVLREEREHLFAPSFAPSCSGGPRVSGHGDDLFISTGGKEFAVPGSTKDYMTFSNIRQRTSPLNYSVDPLLYCPQMHSSFEKHKYSYGKSFSDESAYFHRERSYEPSRHVSFPSAFRPVDLANYPPSHVVEREGQSTSSSFLSPEHWSFPPMRLY
ncbi:proline-rich protein 19 [Eucyclogobius newberryi]|uniref:proline-rich protein 19 n=1 Tax=Eucyclogobius newberryi TaxID=166745 RepID=UPI003B5ADFC3